MHHQRLCFPPLLTLQYETSVVGQNAGQATSPPSNTLFFTTPAANAPANTGEPQSPTVAEVAISPPSVGGPYEKFEVTACPIGGPSDACVKRTCPPPPKSCQFSNLLPLTT